MLLLMFIAIFRKNSVYASIFSSAFTEGIKDTFREMGNKFDKGGIKERKANHLAVKYYPKAAPLANSKKLAGSEEHKIFEK